MSIPEDISIAGYDGIRLAKLTVPNLTTLCQDTQHLGQYAAEKLIDLIEKPKTAMRNITIVQENCMRSNSFKAGWQQRVVR